jgi:hypothetical protein
MAMLRNMSTQAQTVRGPGNRYRKTPVAPHATFWQRVKPQCHRIAPTRCAPLETKAVSVASARLNSVSTLIWGSETVSERCKFSGNISKSMAAS